MSEENEVVEPPVVRDIPQDGVKDNEPSQPPPVATPAIKHTVDVEGRSETVSQEEYEYLAKLGAQTLVASQHQQQQQAQEAQQPSEADKYPPDEDSYEEDGDILNRRMTNIEQQLHNHRLGAQIDTLKRDVEDWIGNGEVMDALKSMEDGDNLLNEVRREVFNKCSQEHMPAEKAFTAIEGKWSKVMGEERASMLLKKLKQAEAAAPGSGGSGPANPGVPFGAADWGDGTLLDSITERLTNSET